MPVVLSVVKNLLTFAQPLFNLDKVLHLCLMRRMPRMTESTQDDRGFGLLNSFSRLLTRYFLRFQR